MGFLNLNKVLAQLRRYGDGVREGATEGVEAEGRAIFERSQELVPVDTGALKASGRVTVERAGDRTIASVSYTAGHAVPIHERLDLAHRVGGPKYLEQAANEIQPRHGSAYRRGHGRRR